MRRSNPEKHQRQRFGRHVTTIGERQLGIDGHQEKLRLIALVAQSAGTQSAQQRIWSRRIMTGKRV